MINNIPQPEISAAFTIEDIHKIREWNYERRKNMTVAEWLADEAAGAQKMLNKIARVHRVKSPMA
jgi:hypothetical protein